MLFLSVAFLSNLVLFIMLLNKEWDEKTFYDISFIILTYSKEQINGKISEISKR